jgi:hypothetical protein
MCDSRVLGDVRKGIPAFVSPVHGDDYVHGRSRLFSAVTPGTLLILGVPMSGSAQDRSGFSFGTAEVSRTPMHRATAATSRAIGRRALPSTPILAIRIIPHLVGGIEVRFWGSTEDGVLVSSALAAAVWRAASASRGPRSRSWDWSWTESIVVIWVGTIPRVLATTFPWVPSTHAGVQLLGRRDRRI